MACTFLISLFGLFLGRQIEKLLKGKIELTAILGGIILLALAVWIVCEHYVV
jgi:putative Mn2+ efflux pump MntP